MVHVDLTGARDLEIPEAVRVYHFGGAQHSIGTQNLRREDPTNGMHGQQNFNCLDYRPMLRAALINLDRWVTEGQEPPPSAHPRLDSGTAVAPENVANVFRAIPGVNFPEPLRRFYRLDFGPVPGVASNVPAVVGKPFPLLVPAVDTDGNELAGVRLPMVTVPLAAYTGWNLRHSQIGGTGQILSSGGSTGGTLMGSAIPFPATKKEREETGDPRMSIEERYSSREDYLARIESAAQELIAQGYLLPQDLEGLVEQAEGHYNELRNRVGEPQAADD